MPVTFGKYAARSLVWGLFTLLYLLFAGNASASEIVAGILAGGATLRFTLLLHVHFRRCLDVNPAWLLQLWKIVPSLFKETWLIYAVLLGRIAGKQAQGRFLEHPYRHDPCDPHAAARFAFMAFGVCVTPNSYLVSYDPQRKRALLRQLAGKNISSVDRAFLELP